MDYETKPTSRAELRLFSRLFRAICRFNMNDPINPIALLERLPDLEGFADVRYEVVNDDELPGNVPAQCIHEEDGYLIIIKNSVYNGAYEKRIGGHRMHIMHEIMHVFADKIGFTPIFSRELIGNVPPYRRLEWIVMALAGEVMMPYEATRQMSVEEIMFIYGVSKSAAEKRKKYDDATMYIE